MPIEMNFLPSVPLRDRESHKGSFGTVLVLAGKRGMSGAAVLCGSSAIRSGAGLVRVATPKTIQPEVAIGNPCYTTIPLEESKQGEIASQAMKTFLKEVKNCTAIVMGPGLGTGETVRKLVFKLLQIDKPMVLDADALNAIAGTSWAGKRRNEQVIITPHPGEFSRLTGLPVPQIQKDRKEVACQFASLWGVTVVLKGAGTVVASKEKVFINQTGNPGMATGGSGDVLAGVIGALLAQGFSLFDAATLGAHVHGRAGDLAREKFGEISLCATDQLSFLPAAFKSLN